MRDRNERAEQQSLTQLREELGKQYEEKLAEVNERPSLYLMLLRVRRADRRVVAVLLVVV